MSYVITVTLNKTRVSAVFAHEMPVGSSVREAHDAFEVLRATQPGFLKLTRTPSVGGETCAIHMEWQSREAQSAFRLGHVQQVREYEAVMAAFNESQGNTVSFAARVEQ